MLLDWSNDCRLAGSRAWTLLSRLVVGGAFLGLVGCLALSAAHAAGDDDGSQPSFWTRFEEAFGLKKKPIEEGSGITYSERSPLVVPPTRDLPPPSAGLQPVPDWPKEPSAPAKRRSHARPAPAAAADANTAKPSETGPAAAPGQPAPSGQAQVGQGQGESAPPQRVPNPAVEPRSFFNPSTWFSREEYATFTREPARDELTDPPAGYRTPSPAQPYGLGPDKKTGKTKTAGDGTAVQSGNATTQTASPTGAPPANDPAK